MTGVMRRFAVVLFVVSSAAGQDYDAVVRQLESGDLDGAMGTFVDVLKSMGGGDQALKARVLERSVADFRDRGATDQWLGALTEVLGDPPDSGDYYCLWYRAFGHLDLKFLSSAASDLDVMESGGQSPSDVLRGRSDIAGLTWDHQMAAKSANSRFASHHRKLASSLAEAASSQWMVLVIGVALMSAIVYVIRRLG